MVALDQRESMRMLFEQAGTDPAPDELLSDFKHDAAGILAEHASAVLLDVELGRRGIASAGSWPDSCALIVAGDVLTQEPGEPPTEADLDPDLDAAAARDAGAAALKLLLYWRGAENADRCQDTAARFLEICRAHGLVGVVEGVVRPPSNGGSWDREAALVDAARAFGACRPDVYKAEVPLYGEAPEAELRAAAERVTEVVGCPWVVLSNGVPRERFEDAVKASCQGGASGFLAGRAVWSDTVGGGDYASRLRAVSLPRLERLAAIVDEHARPYAVAAGG
jgi:sulfofructosephosphate aldolase